MASTIKIKRSAVPSTPPLVTNLELGELAINTYDGKLYLKKNVSGTESIVEIGAGAGTGTGTGDVVGPASAIDTAIALFDGITGKLLKNSSVTIGTTGNTVISGTDNTNAMLRITQLGTGNALVVEDSTNPDATPFIIDATGRVITNYSTFVASFSVTPSIQFHGTGAADASIGMYNWNINSSNPAISFNKSYSGVTGTRAIVPNGQIMGRIGWGGDDGTAFIEAASISAVIDGTPSTADMPGRLVFSTTPDGFAAPIERMRIRSDGGVSIGSSGGASITLQLAKTLTGGTTSYAVRATGLIQSDVTSACVGYSSAITTAASAFTITNLFQFRADQPTLGAGSAVTSQYGFFASSGLTGASNNYGFFGEMAAATARWNFYAGGNAQNFFLGNVGIGTGKTVPATALDVEGTVTATTFSGAGTGLTGTAAGLSIGGNAATASNGGVTSVNGLTGAVTLSTTSSSATYTRTAFTATAGQTVFAVEYNVGYVEVYYNGVLQPSTEYTATNGTSITLVDAAVVNDLIEVIAYSTTSIAVIDGLTLTGGYTEVVYAIPTNSTPALTPTNGSTQTWTLTANSTPTAGAWDEGQSIILMIDDGTAYTITWTSLAVSWKTNTGTAPTLNTTGYTAITLWKVGTVIYGARIGNA